MFANVKFTRSIIVVVSLIGILGCGDPSKSNLSGKGKPAAFRSLINNGVPPQGIKLKKRNSFPREGQALREAFMKMPARVNLDSWGNIYVLDPPSGSILKFSEQGSFIKRLGREGQGPGEFLFPGLFNICDNTMIVNDVRNGRVQYMDLDGNYLSSFRTFEGFYSLSNNDEGRIFVAPRRAFVENRPLIKVLSKDGNLIKTFGTHPIGLGDSSAFDSVVIDVNRNGDVFVAFRLLALVRLYSAAGQLVRELKINHEIMERRQEYNLSLRRSTKASREKRYFVVIESLKATENGFYLLINSSPCLEILKIDLQGKQQRIYYWDEDRSYYARDFAVRTSGNEEMFYLVQVSPDYRIDVFSQN